jgi:hypothetical protein
MLAFLSTPCGHKMTKLNSSFLSNFQPTSVQKIVGSIPVGNVALFLSIPGVNPTTSKITSTTPALYLVG